MMPEIAFSYYITKSHICLPLLALSLKYEGNDKTILEGVNMQFEPGKVYTIVGRSGAGKSTLLHLIAGLDVVTAGRITYDGENLVEIDRNRYRAQKAGIIFQGFNLLTNATALENILLSMYISGVKGIDKKARALGLLICVVFLS
jgi:putative ABC transport system ATP-binding protein